MLPLAEGFPSIVHHCLEKFLVGKHKGNIASFATDVQARSEMRYHLVFIVASARRHLQVLRSGGALASEGVESTIPPPMRLF